MITVGPSETAALRGVNLLDGFEPQRGKSYEAQLRSHSL